MSQIRWVITCYILSSSFLLSNLIVMKNSCLEIWFKKEYKFETMLLKSFLHHFRADASALMECLALLFFKGEYTDSVVWETWAEAEKKDFASFLSSA